MVKEKEMKIIDLKCPRCGENMLAELDSEEFAKQWLAKHKGVTFQE